MEFSEIQYLVFMEYKKNGYEKMWNMGELKFQPVFDIAELGLINTEISEAIETIRKDKKLNLPEELADIIIRTLNFASRNGIDLEEIILAKHLANMKRGNLHGKTV